MDKMEKIIIIWLIIMITIVILPLWVGFIFEVKSKLGYILIVLSIPFMTFPLGMYLINKISNKIK